MVDIEKTEQVMALLHDAKVARRRIDRLEREIEGKRRDIAAIEEELREQEDRANEASRRYIDALLQFADEEDGIDN